MASSYTGLGSELMTTGENAGTWGSKTNTNLQILEQIAGGYIEQDIAGSADTTALSVSDGSTGAVLSHRIIKFTGTITGNQIVTIPLDVQQMYILVNGTSGAYTVQFKYVSGSGSSFTFAATDKGTKLVYATADHATNPNLVDSGIGSTAGHDLDGNELTLDADSDTSITASTDDQIDFEISGADDFTMTANAFNVLTGSHATFADSANAKFGTGNDMLLYHDGTNSYITNSQGALKLATETSGIAITIGHTTSETTVADNLTVTGTLTGTLATAAQGSVTSLGTLTTLTVDNIIVNGTTIGHTSDTDLLTLTSAVLTVAGELDAATLDISGNADIDGTTNLDAVDIDGAVQLDATLTVGADDQGYDIKFFGDTASAYMLWDTSADDLVLAGAAGIDLAGDIDVDGTANLDAVDIDGAVQIDGAVTVGVDGTGLDVKFFGDTAGSFLLWDQSDDALELTDSSPIKIGDAGDMQIYHDGSNSYITNSQGALKVATETSGIAITIGHTTSETTIADNLTVTGTLTGTLATAAQGSVTSLGTLTTLTVDNVITNGATIGHTSDTDLMTLADGVLTVAGELDATTLDISGNADIDGTTNLDAVDIDGAVQLDATLTVGADDQGYDIKFFGDTASAFMLWDTSTDDLVLGGAAKLYLYDAAGGEHISSDGSTLSIAGGGEIDLTATAIDINGTCDISGTFSLAGTNVTATAAEINYSDLATLGTSAASKVLSADSNNLTKITGGVYLEEDTLSFDATQDWDVRASPVAAVVLTANVTFDLPSNPTTGQYISILCIQDGTGSRTIAWNAAFEFTGGTAPTATTTAGKGDLFTFRYHNSHWVEVGRNLNLTRA
jgi:cytoskeletal protein CcmA (bactofilin family)